MYLSMPLIIYMPLCSILRSALELFAPIVISVRELAIITHTVITDLINAFRMAAKLTRMHCRVTQLRIDINAFRS